MKVSKNKLPELGGEDAAAVAVSTDQDADLAKKQKRAVRILENIDDKNDQLTNLRIDNKTKHSIEISYVKRT